VHYSALTKTNGTADKSGQSVIVITRSVAFCFNKFPNVTVRLVGAVTNRITPGQERKEESQADGSDVNAMTVSEYGHVKCMSVPNAR
jgi:hypothetical protein